MFDITLGDARISTIVEVSGPRYAPDFVFPGITGEEISRNIGWMAPDLYDVPSGRIAMVRQTNVVRVGGQTILIDTCVGDCKTRNVPAFNRLRTAWLANFEAAGLRTEEVDLVMCTHLHVDHVGWNTRLIEGRWRPTFPNARYVFGRRELDHWLTEHAAGRDSPDGPVFED
ncbi:MAG: Metallo-beta-lactamase superfamily protein, partial [Rhodobacteraceae bacterium HLUCCA24]